MQLWASEDEDDEGFESKQKENSSEENATDETDTIITNPVKTPVDAWRIDLCVYVCARVFVRARLLGQCV